MNYFISILHQMCVLSAIEKLFVLLLVGLMRILHTAPIFNYNQVISNNSL